MSAWDNVEVDIGGDETRNFGPRLETGSALYQVETHATISTADLQARDVPWISAYASEDSVCVAANEHLSLFQDSCHEILATIAFGSTVDCVACDDNGSFVVLGERNGDLRFLDAVTQMTLFSKKLAQDSHTQSTFKHISFTPLTQDGACELCAVVSDKVFWFSNLQLDLLQEALEEKDMQKAKSIQTYMKSEVLDVSEIHTAGCYYAAPSGESIITCGDGGNVLCVWERDWLKGRFEATALVPNTITGGAAVKKVFVTPCGRLVVALDSRGALSLWDVHTMVLLKVLAETDVDDFLILKVGDTQTEKVKMVLLKKPNKEYTNVVVCELPSVVPIYTLQLGPIVFLAPCPVHQEAIMLIEGINDDDNSDTERISTLRVRSLIEAQPETRFNRMLHRKQFDEAEKFAQLFNLDTESVYNVKIIHLLDELSHWNIGRLTPEQIEDGLLELKACMGRVADDGHIAQCCATASLPSFQATLELLQLAKSRLGDKGAPGKTADRGVSLNREALLIVILETLQKLGTFQVAFGIEAFSGAKWEEFLKANIWHEFLKWLCQGNINVAFTLWRRHQFEFEDDFGENHLEDTLSSIPEHTPARDLTPWLAEDLIPFVIRIYPEGLGQIAAWLEQRARNMEIMEKVGWPENALAVCELLRNTCVSASQAASERGNFTPHHFATQVCNLSVGYSQVLQTREEESGVRSDPFVRLHTLIDHLTNLVSLHRNYNCYLSLAEYVQETTETITYRMLDRVVAVELIPDAIRKVVRPYMKEHNLSADKMLYQYIGDLVGHSGQMMSVLGEAPWESKAIAVIECIQSAQFKIGGILDAMKCAYIPWSTEMDALIKQGLQLNHPRVEELKKQCQVAELRQMLAGYDLRHYNVAESANAETLLCYILKQDRPTAMEDGLLVVSAFSKLHKIMAFSFRFRFLVESERLGEAFNLLNTLDQKDTVYCCQRVLQLTLTMLENSIVFERTQLERKKIYTGASCEILSYMIQHTTDAVCRKEWATLQTNLRAIHALQVEFNEYIGHSDYANADVRATVLNKYIQQYFTSVEKLNAKLPEKAFDPDRKPARRATWTLPKLYSDVFANSCNTATAEVLYKVAHCLSQYLATGKFEEACRAIPNLPAVISDMAARAVTYCPAELLLDCLELSKCSHMAYSVARQCESGDYDVTIQRKQAAQKQDVYKEWTFEPVFKEDGLVMDSDAALPDVYKYNLVCLPSRAKTPYPFLCNRAATRGKKAPESKKITDDTDEGKETVIERLCKSALAVVSHLKENSQIELALMYAVRTLAVCFQQQSTEKMGTPFADQEEMSELTSSHDRAKPLLTTAMKLAVDLTTLLMHKVFNASPIDHSLALGFLCAVSGMSKLSAFDQLKKIEKNMGCNYRKVLDLANIGVEYSEMCGEHKMKTLYEDLQANASWGKQLAKIKVNFKEAFKEQSQAKEKLLWVMVRNESVDVDKIVEYCRAFKLNEDNALFLYLKHILIPPLNCPVNDFASKASQVIRAMTVAVDRVDKLQQMLAQIDPYDYERLEFVLSVLKDVAPSKSVDEYMEVLKCIQSYKRTKPPSQYEVTYKVITEEEQMMSSGSRLSPLSRDRLPFHPLVEGDPWKIITPELSADTVTLWIPIANVLRLSHDQLYLTTMKNIVISHTAENKSMGGSQNIAADKSKCNWDMKDGVDHTLFETMMSILMKVHNVELAVTCAGWVVKELPMGAEKVFALKNTATLSAQWVKIAKEGEALQRAQETCKKFTTMCRCLSTEQILFQAGLGEPELIELAALPARLLLTLYEHESIVKRVAGTQSAASLPDIHGAAGEIASTCGLSLDRIHQNLVCKWLPSTHNKNEEADTTMNMTFNMNNLEMTTRSEEEISEDEINLKRVIYILQHGDLEQSSLYLVGYMQRSDPSITTTCRVRALRCLFSLVDNNTVSKLVKQPIEKVKEFMQTLLYIVELERLHFPHTVESFIKSNKAGLVKGIWRNHNHDYRAVRLVSDMCLDFAITDVQLWDSILQQLLAFHMVDYLRHVLVCLSGLPELWQVDSVQRMWRSVLLSPLSAAVAPLTAEQLAECRRTLCLLHRCPVLLHLDLVQFTKQFNHLEVKEMALSCALLITRMDTRDAVVKNLLSGDSHIEILQKLDEWRNKGTPIPLEDQMKCLILRNIEERGLYDVVERSDYLRDFVVLLIQTHTLNNFLLHQIKANKLVEAAEWVNLYVQIHPDSGVARLAKARAITATDNLKLYLKENELFEEVEEFFPSEADSSHNDSIESPAGSHHDELDVFDSD